MIRFERAGVTFRGEKGRETVALEGLDLEIPRGETLALLGPSGSGKTTALRLINRSLEPTSGRVLVEGRDVRAVDPLRLRRRTGYVIQGGALFPHLTVAGNIGLLPRLEGWPRPKIEARVRELLTLVRLEPAEFEDRFPRQLSGGQAQRVGVARALALDPPVVLLDEPFGALDPITRKELQDEFAELAARLGKTMVLVTHDASEALRLADRIAVIVAGRLQQVGPPHELIERPATETVERLFAGVSNA